MPEMDGLALKCAIGEDLALATRVVLMTSFGEDRDVRPAAESGIVASVSKPVHLAELRTAVRVALGFQVAEGVPVEATSLVAAVPGEHRVGRLLLAEDNVINQKVAVAMLSSVGYQVDTVLNGAEAVDAAAARPYDAILMDCQMPEMNGYEATAAIRKQEGPDQHVPIIAMTAGARRQDRERCLAEGMDSYLAKPVSKDALLALVARSMTLAPVRTRKPDPPPTIEPALDAQVTEQLEQLGEAAGEDLMGQLTILFLTDSEIHLAELRAGVAEHDGSAIYRAAHTLTGASANIGAIVLSRLCSTLARNGTADDLTASETLVEAVAAELQRVRTTLESRSITA
jgi:CheY-like chemotaxis protein